MEGKLDLLLKHAGLQFDPFAAVTPEVMAALREGRKIEAIKLYRQATGADLAEAKEIIEEAQRRR
jgi:ribosomal protein L7/L12